MIRHPALLLFTLLLGLLMLPASQAGDALGEYHELDQLSSGLFLDPLLEYVEDHTGQLQSADITTDILQRDALNSMSFGYTESVYWFRFSIV